MTVPSSRRSPTTFSRRIAGSGAILNANAAPGRRTMKAVGPTAARSAAPRFVRGWTMLVVTSNWAIADGTLYGGPDRGCVADFFTAIHRRALRAGFRRDGTYRPVDSVDVVLAGDTCDWLVSALWTDRHRPWHGGRTAAGIAERVAVGSLRRGGRLLAGLSRLARRGLRVPRADARGRPVLGTLQQVAVRVTVLAGDRDHWIERHSRSVVATARSVAVGSAWSNGIAMVRHGDDLDPLCGTSGRWSDETSARGDAPSGGGRAGGDDSPSLGESIAVDLLARFGGAVAAQGSVRPLLAALMRRLATARTIDMADHLADGVAGSAVGSGVRRQIVTAWRRAVGSWHREARRTIEDGDEAVGWIDPLAAWLDGVEGPRSGRLADGFPEPSVLPLASVGGEADTPPLLVLGHPSAGVSRTTAGRSVCLGPAPLHGTEIAPLRRATGVDVAWIDAARMGGPAAMRAPATIAVFDEPMAASADVADGLPPQDDHHWIRDGRSIRLETLSAGRAGAGTEWIGIGSGTTGSLPSDDGRHPRIVDAA